jgi:hypothetical protein
MLSASHDRIGTIQAVGEFRQGILEVFDDPLWERDMTRYGFRTRCALISAMPMGAALPASY